MSELITIISDNAKTEKCLVLDVDETLVHTFCKPYPFSEYGIGIKPELNRLYERFIFFDLEDMDGKPGEGLNQMFYSLKRPYLDEIITFFCSYFSVINIYSAGIQDYVDTIVRNLFRYNPCLNMVWGRSKCVESTPNVFTKPLELIYKEDSKMTPQNTLILDDNPNAFMSCNPYNGVLIPRFLSEADGKKITLEEMLADDIAFLQFKQWLLTDQVMKCTDVRTLDKNSIFTTPLGIPATSRLYGYTPLINSVIPKYTNPVSLVNSMNYTPMSAFKYSTNFFIQPIRVN